jgi:1-acyl-sn-glycerol-3-phosphate acyltransferase
MRYLYVIWATALFIAFFLVLFPLFLCCSLLGPWGKKAIWYLIKAWSHVWFFLIGMYTKRIFLQPVSKNQNYIVVANHVSYIDTPLIFRTMPFPVRPLAKKELAQIPLFGFLYRQMAVLVDRSNDKSKAHSVQHLRRTLQREGSIFIFPEGTFNETNDPLKFFYDGAFRLALQTRTNILPVIYPDSINRWNYKSFWNWSPGINRAIFLPEIDITPFLPNNVSGLKQVVFEAMSDVMVRNEPDRLF